MITKTFHSCNASHWLRHGRLKFAENFACLTGLCRQIEAQKELTCTRVYLKKVTSDCRHLANADLHLLERSPAACGMMLHATLALPQLSAELCSSESREYWVTELAEQCACHAESCVPQKKRSRFELRTTLARLFKLVYEAQSACKLRWTDDGRPSRRFASSCSSTIDELIEK